MAEPGQYLARVKAVSAMQTALVNESTTVADREAINYPIMQWVIDTGGSVLEVSGDGVLIESPDGNYTVGNGWWIVRDENGFFYPMDPLVFQARYISVNGDTPDTPTDPDAPWDEPDLDLPIPTDPPTEEPPTEEEPTDGTDPTPDPETDPDAAA